MISFQNKKKSPFVAAVLNLCLPGTGYFYARKTAMGIGFVVFVGIIIAAAYITQIVQITSLLAVISFCGMIDGFFVIQYHNRTAEEDDLMTVTCRNCKKKTPLDHRNCTHCHQSLSSLRIA